MERWRYYARGRSRKIDNSRPQPGTDAEEPASVFRFVKWGLIAAAILGVAVLLYIYAAPREALAFRVGASQATWTISGPGLVDALNKVSLTARIQGRLVEVAVQRNDRVTTGQVLAKLASEDLDNQLLASKADAEAAKRQVIVARGGRIKAQALLDKATGDLTRRQQLAESGTVTKADLEAVEAAYRQAQAELEIAAISIERAEAQARAAEANVKSLLARAQDAILTSPLNGVVISRERNVGDVVLPGATVLQLLDPTSIILSARFDESVMGAMSPSLRAAIEFNSEPGKNYEGHVIRVGRVVDQETREFTADISLDSLPRNWALGQRAKVTVDVTTHLHHFLVPQKFVRRADGKAGFWIASNGRAFWRDAILGIGSGPYVEVVEGLKDGDVILEPRGLYWLEPVTPKIQ
jgi:HlyD family secretion protein